MAVFLSNQSGLWSSAITWLTAANGTLSPTAPAGEAPQSGGGDKFVIRGGHVVEYDTVGEFGDGTNNGTANSLPSISANAIVLSGGELKCSRTVNTELSAYGNIMIANSGVWNWGTASDPVTAVTSLITLNAYRTSAVGGFPVIGRAGISFYSYGYNAAAPAYTSFYTYGKEKTVNAYLTLSGLSGSNSITVNDANGWQIGDKLVIETEAVSAIATRTLSATFITGIAGNTISINPTLNENKSALRKVCNFSNTITYTSKFIDQPSYGLYLLASTKSNIQIQNCSFNEVGCTAWSQLSSAAVYVNPNSTISMNIGNYDNNAVAVRNISLYSSYVGTGAVPNTIAFNGALPEFSTLENIGIYNPAANSVAIQLNSLINCNVNSVVVIRAAYGINPSTGFPNKVNVNNSYFCNSIAPIGPATNGLIFNVNNSTLKSGQAIVFLDGLQNFNINNCTLQFATTYGITRPNRNAAGVLKYNNCNIIQPSGIIGRDPTGTSLSNKTNYDCSVNIISLSGNIFDNRRFNYYYYSISDLTKRKNGINSWRFKPENANTLLKSIDTIPATVGITQKLKGNIQFDSNYGTSYPPSISFVGAGVDQTFTCGPTANIWQTFELDLTPTETGEIDVTLTGQSSATSGYIWLDGLNIEPFVKTVKWYGYEFDNNIFRTVDTLTTLTEVQVSALGSISNLDELYDAANYWSVTNPASSSYINLYTANGTVLDFDNKNIVINNTGTALSYDSSTNTITLDAPTLSAGTNFDTLKTSGTVTLSTGLISNIDINAPIVQTIPTNLTGVFMLNGTLTYNTNTPIEIEYTNCTMVGVQNTGTAIVTIKRTNSTVTESDAEITTYAPTLINLTLQDGYIALYDDTDTRQYFQNTDGTLILPANATGNWSYKIARYGYQLVAGSFTVNPAVGGTIDIAPSYIPDTFITQSDVSVVSGYTDLNGTDKIHDYLSYYLTTSTGIDYGILDSESFGVLSFYGNLTLSNSATSVIDYNSGTNTLKLKSSSVNDSIIFVVASAFTQDGGNTIGDNLKIRASNIDSEFYFSNVNSITFYPSQSDRDNNTNAGITTSGTIYRFKYGSTVSGVTLSGYAYSRVTVDSILLLDASPINSGSNTIDFGTTGVLQSIIANQKIINTGVQKASKLIPHTTNI